MRYIVFAILIILVLVTGYAGIKNIFDKGESADLILLKNQMQKDINSMSGRYNDIKTVKYALPSEFNEICFVDLEHADSDLIAKETIKSSVADGIKDNVFLFGNKAVESVYVGNLQIANPPYYTCVNPQNNVLTTQIIGANQRAYVRTTAYFKYCNNTDVGGHDGEILCEWLDEVFWPGYEEECCDLHDKCCY